MTLHVFRRWYDIRSRLQRWLKAGLATEAARIATETVDVGPSGVVGYPPCLGVERVLLIDVIILFVSGLKWDTHTHTRVQTKTDRERVHALTLCRSALRCSA